MKFVHTVEELEARYGVPSPASIRKVADHLTAEYGRWVAAAKFCILSTVGPEGTDATPRGDDGPVVKVLDAKTILLPDWAGNNRCDSLRNIIRDDRLSLMFMVPGSDNVVRVNGRGNVTFEDVVCARFEREGMLPRSVLVVTIGEVYFQCAKAIMRADLWGDAPDVSDLPSAGQLLKSMTGGEVGGGDYDRSYVARARTEFWQKK